MKVIISRKGFDSKFGGCASPVFPDNSMVSLPIPTGRAGTTFGQVAANGRDAGHLVEMLTGNRIKATQFTHLDPDIDEHARPRLPGWLPAFGQVGAPLTHLDNRNVGEGDLFLFFGWFRRVIEDSRGMVQFVPDARNLHALFGWLQIGEMVDVEADTSAVLAAKPWLADHPHVTGRYEGRNRIYVASERLSIPLLPGLAGLPGGGAFGTLIDSRTLTHPDSQNRSFWRLPSAFSPAAGLGKLSCHESPQRWTTAPEPGGSILKAVSQGQEFVLEMSDARVLADWLRTIFSDKEQPEC